MTLVDSNILIDVLFSDPAWFGWSRKALAEQADIGELVIVDIIFSEVSIGFAHVADVEAVLDAFGIRRMPMSAAALFAAGQAFKRYRLAGGPRTSMLPDFLIGAHAQTEGMPILTRDIRRYGMYFPGVALITP